MIKTTVLSATIVGFLATAVLAQTSPGTSGSSGTSGTTGTTGTGSAGATDRSGTTSAAPKSRAECESNWRTMDRNSDGRLDRAEMDAGRSTMPGSLMNTSSQSLTQQEFLAACSTR